MGFNIIKQTQPEVTGIPVRAEGLAYGFCNLHANNNSVHHAREMTMQEHADYGTVWNVGPCGMLNGRSRTLSSLMQRTFNAVFNSSS